MTIPPDVVDQFGKNKLVSPGQNGRHLADDF